MSTKRKEESLSRTMGKSRSKRPHQSRRESERDSGFSDASSEYLGGVGKAESDDASQPSQLAVVRGFSPNVSPMIIMNNVLLKQPSPPSLNKRWGFSPGVEMVPPPQVVFLQPVVSACGPPASTEPPSKRRRHKKYLPILKSYPKIAPHPGDSPHQTSSSSSSGCSTASSSYSSASSAVKSGRLSSGHQGRHRRGKKASASGSSTPCSTPHRRDKKASVSGSSTPYSTPASPLPHITLTDSTPPSIPAPECPALVSRSESVPLDRCKSTDSRTLEFSPLQTQTETALEFSPLQTQTQTQTLEFSPTQTESGGSSPSVCGDITSQDGDGASGTDSDGSKHKRFCNTYNILSKSGLLDITLRTKELIRQNRRTQGDLERLRDHTALFMEVLKSGDLHVFHQLQNSMQGDTDREKNAA